ncbi:DNA-processing protein DprA [Parapedobacter lycopersici]|uniref:DNA-processing protein DprA n=1 Tax=Parapedobacter lycopersici TaxID=1864939 RepID=UPI0033402416
MNLLYPIALTKIKGVGPVLARSLLSYFGSAEAVFSASSAQLKSIPGIGNQLSASIQSPTLLAAAEAELRFIEQHGIQMLFYESADYPERLKDCFDAPLLLYYKGVAKLNNPRIVSVVGTRNATEYGKFICADLIRELASYDVLVVSGLAYGIDSHAHRNAVAAGIPTVGVMGHGLDRIYPASNRELATRMLDNGGLLTEFPSGTRPDKQHFPMRNRIIAGLADVTVVVEAASRGGALITAELANSYHRDVCAFPGSIRQEFSAGCNYLIKTNRAHLISNGKDLVNLMNWTPAGALRQTTQQAILPSTLSDTEQALHDVINQLGQARIEELASRLMWPQSKLAMVLLELEMKGVICALPGNSYRLLSSH